MFFIIKFASLFCSGLLCSEMLFSFSAHFSGARKQRNLAETWQKGFFHSSYKRNTGPSGVILTYTVLYGLLQAFFISKETPTAERR